MNCIGVPTPFLFLFDNGDLNVPALLYYTHIPVAIVTIILGIFIYKNNKKGIANKILFTLSLAVFILIVSNLASWVNDSVSIVIFAWNINKIMYFMIPILSVYSFYTLVKGKDISNTAKGVWLTIISIYSLFTFSKWSILNFNITDCNLFDQSIVSYIQIIFVVISVLLLIWLYVKSILNNVSKEIKIVNSILFSSLLLFILNLFFIYQIAYYLSVLNGGNYNYELYALLGLPIFLGSLAYTIVKYKTFNIKLLGAQALMWTIGLLIASQFFFIKATINQILTLFTLMVVMFAGYILVKSVKKVDEQKELLEIANTNQQTLIHFISHQVKGFFTKSKMVFAGIMEGDFGEANPVMIEMARAGIDSDNNAVAMIQNILGASNLKTGTTTFNLKKLDLVEIVKKIAGTFTEQMAKKGLKFELDISPEPLWSMVDDTQITQVFKNLIDNSMRYTPTGEIKVTLKVEPQNNNKAFFSIKDTGVGLSEEDKARLFTEGGKGTESIKVNTDSTGYGLYIVKKIVESHYGRIWAESSGRGLGSQFYVELNLSK